MYNLIRNLIVLDRGQEEKILEDVILKDEFSEEEEEETEASQDPEPQNSAKDASESLPLDRPPRQADSASGS